ncbi:tetraprenyl-beta-curcumene synthase family protein [Sporosarcina sp. 179-K 3D1 HS]|uniref:tetraprenyl-beta-curcumene synthase family protein n=1 Tax=Sporosarcina sp. 179-K 3D1 HS TaxID=3232169 RepID=UPI0039A0EAFE
MSVPLQPLTLMSRVYRDIMPIVHEELRYWKRRAQTIPNAELRQQALTSIEHKTFHCEGGAILALTALERKNEAIRFIVAYQTISDYLDNLCDRSTSLDPEDFTALHEAMADAVTVEAPVRVYYRFRDDRDDGGYLAELVQVCQSVLGSMAYYEMIRPYLLELCHVYSDLQIHKHVRQDERVDRLQTWFAGYRSGLPEMGWHEFSACAGSTLGIFCLVSYAMRPDFRDDYPDLIYRGYFPFIQGLHILLDYLIDQEEDREGGDLNFCFYYENVEELFGRLLYFFNRADTYAIDLPDPKFHKMIIRGLLGIYLSDRKVDGQRDVKPLAKKVLKRGGAMSHFFYWNGRGYRWVQDRFLKLRGGSI